MTKSDFISYKKIIIIILTLIFSLNLDAQDKVPQSISYQAVARDDDGFPIRNKDIVVEITIMLGSEEGQIIWQELHEATTNDLGVFNLLIGKGTTTSVGSATDFASIKWAKDDFFIKTRVDFGVKEFGNGLIDVGTVQLQSVPYALVADTALHASMLLREIRDVNVTGLTAGQGLGWNGSNWVPSSFINSNGTTDLTKDWIIKNNSIKLNNGSLSSASLQISSGATITNITTSVNISSPSNTRMVTEKAVFDFVKSQQGTSYWAGNSNATMVYNISAKIGIGTSSPQDKFHAEVANAGFLVTGNYENGGQSKMTFLPYDGAFRAGFVDAGNPAWNKDNIGDFSTAFGKNNQASGQYSFSVGDENKVFGTGASAFGQENEVHAIQSIAIGYKNVTDNGGAYCAAIGRENTANAWGSAAIGLKTKTNGDYSFAFGEGTTTNVKAQASMAVGSYSQAKAVGSIALGVGVKAESFGEISVGCYNTVKEGTLDDFNAGDRLFIVGNGSGNASRSDALVVMKNGNVGIGKSKPSAKLDVSGNIVASGSVSGSSDKRFKTNIEPMKNALQKVLSLEGVYYNWKVSDFPERKFTDKKQIGVIAQDVEKILPEVVLTDEEGYKAVDYSKMVSLLIEAIKEQNKIIETLKKENATKESELKALNSKVNKLSNQMDMILQMMDKSVSDDK